MWTPENLVMNDIADQLYILLDVTIATVLTALIGIEREKAHKPAGIRTNMIVGGATCLIVSLTIPLLNFFENYNMQNIISTDPIRVLQAIIVGISFIGAGTVIKLKDIPQVTGLTTAATLLYSSGIGICVALKQYILAIGITLLIIIINAIISHFISKNPQ